MLAFEGFDPRLGLSGHHGHLVGLLDIHHVAGIHKLAAAVVVEDEDAFVRAELVLGLEFLRAGEAAVGVNVFGGELLFRGKLVLPHQGLQVGHDLGRAGKEDDRADGLLEVGQQVVGLRAKGKLLVTGIVPAFEMAEAEVIQHRNDERDDDDLDQDIEADLEALDTHGLRGGGGRFGSHRDKGAGG